MRTKVLWIAAVITVIAVVVLGGVAGWFALRSSFDDSMSSVWVTEDVEEAGRIAEAMGVRLNDSAVDYGQVTSQFQGSSMAYLVVKADSAVLRDRIIRQSRLNCATTDPATTASLRPPSSHGPPPSPSLMTCIRLPAVGYDDTVPAGERGGDLTVWFDPQAGDHSTWLYISAIPPVTRGPATACLPGAGRVS